MNAREKRSNLETVYIKNQRQKKVAMCKAAPIWLPGWRYSLDCRPYLNHKIRDLFLPITQATGGLVGSNDSCTAARSSFKQSVLSVSMVVAAVVVVVTMINLNRRRLLQHRQVGTANCLQTIQTADGTTEPGGATLTLCVVRGSASSSGMQWVGVRKTWSNDLSIFFFFPHPIFFFNQSASQFLLCFVVPD